MTKMQYVVTEYADEQAHSGTRDRLLSDALVQKLGSLAAEAKYPEWEDLQYDLGEIPFF